MYLLGIRADKVDEGIIKRLVESEIQESKILEYKRELSIDKENDKKEFLYDVTSIYNTEGGCLIYGIEEKKDNDRNSTGIPEKITGIEIDNYDKLSLKIEDTIKNCTEPSISNIIIKQVIVEGKSVLILGIPKGLGLPVMVTYQKINKFYRRRNSGKFLVDVYELNLMFMQNQILNEAAEKFRMNRIHKVLGREGVRLNRETSIFIHILPFSFLSGNNLDIKTIINNEIISRMKPIFSNSGCSTMYNLNGFYSFSKNTPLNPSNNISNQLLSYDQLFRNGIYESYSDSFSYNEVVSYNVKRYINGKQLILKITKKIEENISLLTDFEIEPPFLIGISLFNVSGIFLQDSNGIVGGKFNDNEIILPYLVLQSVDSNIYTNLKPLFDILWQAANCSSSPNPFSTM